MVLRFVYMSKPLVKDLTQEIHDFINRKNIGISQHGNKVVNIPEIRWNNDLKVFEVSITLDVPFGPNPISQKENVNMVDNVSFNVTNEDEQKEIARLQKENEEKKQAEVTISA